MNSARLLDEVLSQAARVAGEIVIVDSGSTDDTLEIAASHGATIVRQPWLGNGYQKRVGEDACGHDWLLDLDSDEVLSDEIVAAIHGLWTQGDGEPPLSIYALDLTTVDPSGRSWGKIGSAWRNKLYRKSVVRQPESGAWDQFDVPAGETVGKIDGELHHYLFNDLADLTAKQNRATTNRARGRDFRSDLSMRARVFFGLPLYFLKSYVIRRMFLRGVYGVVLATAVAHSRWMIDVKLYERSRGFGMWADETGRAKSRDAA